jgi:hypothetical protein
MLGLGWKWFNRYLAENPQLLDQGVKGIRDSYVEYLAVHNPKGSTSGAITQHLSNLVKRFPERKFISCH